MGTSGGIVVEPIQDSALVLNPFVGIAVADNAYGPGSATTSTASGTSRKGHTVGTACTDLRLVYSNPYSSGATVIDADGTNTLVLACAIEIAGTIYPLTVNGELAFTLDGPGIVTTDPLSVEVAAGTVVYSRTFVASGTWHSNCYSGTFTGGGGWTVTSNLTLAGSAAIADSNSNLFVPSMVVGTPTSVNNDATQGKSVVIVGDSIAHGQGDNTSTGGFINRNLTNARLAGGGFIARALYGNVGFTNLAIQTDEAAWFTAAAGHFRRARFIPAGTTLICEYGVNDVSAGKTVAQLAALLITIWNYGKSRRVRAVIQTTITPTPTSTDLWQTVGNQTVGVHDTVRVGLNTWLRAGAPIDPVLLTYVAVGTAGALTMGQPNHPLTGVWEVAYTVESAPNSGLWAGALNARTVADGACTEPSTTITSATANFTAADVGRKIFLAGAGSAGGLYGGVIAQVNSTTSVGCATATATTVSGASLTVSDPYTIDGIHPSVNGHTLIAAALNVALVE